MILGQLIQTGRRFCECRSQDFIPESDDVVVVIAYSISDQFLAQRFEVEGDATLDMVRRWLEENRAIAYILVSRHYNDFQSELPAPIGRAPSDRVTITAATTDSHSYATYLLENHPLVGAIKLLNAAPARDVNELASSNLFLHYERDEYEEENRVFDLDELLHAR